MKLRALAAGGVVGVLSVGFGAAPALAAGQHGVTAATHTHHNADTTTARTRVATGGVCVTTTGGPVWAYDNLSLRFSVTPGTATGDYVVTITVSGSFDSFANRFTCVATNQRGSVRGWITYTVSSSAGPDAKSLPAQESGNVGLGAMIDQLFQTTATITGTQGYSFTYTLVTGQKYVTAS